MKTQRDVNTRLPLRRRVGALTSAALFLVSLLGMPILPLSLCAQDYAITNEPRGLIFQTGTNAGRIKRMPKLGSAYTNTLGMKFVSMPGSEVMFCIWETRVRDFEAFVKATGHDATAGMYSLKEGKRGQNGDSWRSPGFSQSGTHAVCGVSWEDAKAFCEWLTRKEGKTYRLPTDVEWSVAVGLSENPGGTPKDKDCKIRDVYPWGTQCPPPNGAGNYCDVSAKANHSSWTIIEGYNDGCSETAPVGSFAANPSGLYDMGGNVWEWCEDWYDGEQKARVLRGASWRNSNPVELLSSFRGNVAPGLRSDGIGFRVVLVGASPHW